MVGSTILSDHAGQECRTYPHVQSSFADTNIWKSGLTRLSMIGYTNHVIYRKADCMERLKLKVCPRTDMRKSHIKKLKAQHLVPGNIFGLGMESTPIEINLGELAGIFKTEHGAHSIIDLSVEGTKTQPELVVIRNLQKNPITRRVEHVEFQRVSLTEKISATAPIVLKGEAKGVAEGGVLEHVMREAHIRCLPDNIPDAIELDISDIEIGQHKSVSELPTPDGVEILGHAEDLVVAVRLPIVHVEKVAVVEEKPAEEIEGEAEPQEPSKES